MNVDVPTLILSTQIASLTMAMVMLLVGRGRPGEGLQLWAGALMLQASGYLFFGLRNEIDPIVSIFLGNVLSAVAFALLLAAVRRFHGAPPRWLWVLVVPTALVALALALWLDNYSMRVALCSGVFAVQSAAVVLFLWQREGTGQGTRLVMGGMAFEALVLGARAVAGALDMVPSGSLLAPSTMQTLTFLGTFALMVVTSLGFVFMGKERADEANRVLAASDALTGVANRRSIIAALDRDVGRAIRTRMSLALMMIDLDHFKLINDHHGHLAGDAMLRNLVDVVQRRIRSQDLMGRYGGEEFLVVLPDTARAGAEQLAHNLCQAVAAETFMFADQRIQMTISIGVWAGRLEPGESWDLLIHAADSALYRAKNGGRNRVEVTTALPRSAHGGLAPETMPSSLQ